MPESELTHSERTSFARLGNLLRELAWPNRARSAAAAARAATGARPRLQLGMTISRSAGPCLSTDSRARPVLTRLVAEFVSYHVPGLPFCSLALAHSSEAGAHEDPNVGETALVALGRFAGGRLWTYDVAADSIRTYVVKRKFVLFNARDPHGTTSFRGGMTSGAASAHMRQALPVHQALPVPRRDADGGHLGHHELSGAPRKWATSNCSSE